MDLSARSSPWMAAHVRAPRREAAPLARLRRAGGLARTAVGFFGTSVLRSYAQIFFARSPWVGAVFFAATWFSPNAALLGLLGTAAALALALVARLSRDLVHSGAFGYSALLIGLGCGALFGLAPGAVALALGGALATVPITAALLGVLTTSHSLPVLAWPYLVVFALLCAGAPAWGVPLVPVAADAGLALPEPLAFFGKSLGALFFVPREDAGLLVALGLLANSRIAFALAALGAAAAWALLSATLGSDALAAQPALALGLSCNMVLTAVALGGVWFVPGRSALLLAGVGAGLCALFAVGGAPLFARLGLSAAILPFHAAVTVLLLAMRQRTRDGAPKAVDFAAGTPEENLRYHATRIRRFGARYSTRFAAPFLGRWTCTQGVDGAFTHRGPWREALDFEAQGADGRFYSGSGEALTDYYGYRSPVCATAAGTVVRVVDGVPDNAVGTLNLRENWGNAVVLQHGPNLYSLVAHLSPGTLRVREGQWVQQGDVLGGCGNSGRSAVPHVHFQLQATPTLGAPTIAVELHDVVLDGADPRLRGACVPRLGAVVRNLDGEDAPAALTMPRDVPVVFAHDNGAQETITYEVGLVGREVLRSAWGATLFFELRPRLFTAFDVLGPSRSLLSLWRVALPRLPRERGALRWHDQIPATALPLAVAGVWARINPFASSAGLTMDYQASQEGEVRVVTGTSRRRDAAGEPLVRTEARLGRDGAVLRLRVVAAGRTRCVEQVPALHAHTPTPQRLPSSKELTACSAQS